MRIVIDMQGAQTASRFRGIGRYTLAIAKAIVKNRGNHEVLLVLNGLFEESVEAIRHAFAELLPPHHVLVWMAPGPVNVSDPQNAWREAVARPMREAFLASLQPDVIYVSSLFEGFVDNAITSVGAWDTRSLVCSTVYDFIPLLNPEQYLTPHPVYAGYYTRKIEEIKKSGLLLAISESSRREAIDHLGVKPEVVVNMAAACDEVFKPRLVDEASRVAVLQKWKVDRPFILYTGGADDRKNLPRLIEAYSALPNDVRTQYQLLFAGKLSDVEVAHLRHTAHRVGVSENDLRLTGFVSDDELVMAYNLCHLFVFPSWHEGFGLPALEAMACGAPVIAANTSSLPEVVGAQSALFDPFSIESMTGKMLLALTDPAFRQSLVDNGHRQSQKFSWDASARKAIQAFERAVRHRQTETAALRPWSETGPAHYHGILKSIAKVLQSHGISSQDSLAALASCLAHNEAMSLSMPRQGLLPTTLAWRLEGPFDSSYSLALVNRELARALEKIGHRVALHSSEGPGDFTPDPSFLLAHADLRHMHLGVQDMPAADAHILSRFMYPPRVQDMQGQFNVLHCYGWEESRFPAAWAEAFNRHLQGITVMSTHVAKVLVDSGVRVPIGVVGLGTDHWERVTPDAEFAIQAKSFRFLHVSSCFPRKGVEAMLQAYGRAFRKHDDVTLVIKTFDNPHNDIRRWLEQARQGDENYPDVQILMGDFSDAQLKSLYQQCHVLLAPSKAEGFGLPLAEAMLSGLAVVTTGWSGQVDFCTHETAWLVDYAFVRAQSHFGLSDSVWAEPDVRQLAQTMREVHEASADALARRVQAGRRMLADHFTWEQVARRSEHFMRLWAGQCPAVSPRVGWVTSWNTRCGIASYASHLLRHTTLETRILASHAESRTQEDDGQVIRCWTQGDNDRLKTLSQVIETQGIDVLLIQFNYGFFDFPSLANFLLEQVQGGRKVLVEMHATTDPSQVPSKKLSDLVPALMQCARVLVHTPADMNRLKAHGVVNNVTLFPLGILDHEPSASGRGQRSTFVVATYGFFLPHKGLLELVRAVLMLRAQGLSIALRMMNAEYPVAQSRQAIEQVRLEIEAANAWDAIELVTDYQDDEESLRQLGQADLIVFPYQETGESSSAAVRHGIASGRPVAVTPLGIFDDVSDAVDRLPGTSPALLAQGLQALMRKMQDNSPEMLDKSNKAAQWRAAHRHSHLGERLDGLLMALHGQ